MRVRTAVRGAHPLMWNMRVDHVIPTAKDDPKQVLSSGNDNKEAK